MGQALRLPWVGRQLDRYPRVGRMGDGANYSTWDAIVSAAMLNIMPLIRSLCKPYKKLHRPDTMTTIDALQPWSTSDHRPHCATSLHLYRPPLFPWSRLSQWKRSVPALSSRPCPLVP